MSTGKATSSTWIAGISAASLISAKEMAGIDNRCPGGPNLTALLE